MLPIPLKSLLLSVLLMVWMVPLQAAETKADQAVLMIGQELAGMRDALGLYCMVGMKIKYNDPAGRIEAAAKDYEKVLHQLKSDFDADAVQEKIKTSETAWQKFKAKMISVKGDPGVLKGNALYIHAHIRTVLKGLEEIKSLLLAKAANGNAPSINAAVEIGASAKRLSAHYLMKIWKLDDPTIDKHWKAGVKRYRDGIALLKQSSWYSSDPAFHAKLSVCEKELKYFEMMYTMGKGAPTVIDTKSNAVLSISQELIATIQNTK